MNYIKFGDTGCKVRVLQKLLGLDITDVFDENTRDAVLAFQKENNLLVDAIVGEKTFAKLANLKYPRRWINSIFLHCSATKEGADFSAKDIDRWHKAQGWSGIGYHYFVKIDGTVEEGRNIDKTGAHCEGKNAGSIGVCYCGGLSSDGKKPKDTRTDEQKKSLLLLVECLMILNCIKPCDVHCHNEYAKKACPSFSIESFRQELKEDGW